MDVYQDYTKQNRNGLPEATFVEIGLSVAFQVYCKDTSSFGFLEMHAL